MVNKKVLNQLKKVLAKQPIKLAYLYGSFARGQEGKKSDLDIAVVLKNPNKDSFLEVGGEISSVIKGIEVDVREINLTSPPVFLRNVLKEGKPVCVQNERERVNFEVAVMKKFYDSAYLRNFMTKYVHQAIKKGNYGRRQDYH